MWFLLSEDVLRGSRGAAFCGVIKLKYRTLPSLAYTSFLFTFSHLSLTDNVLILPEGLL